VRYDANNSVERLRAGADGTRRLDEVWLEREE
jgi:hypothetical protein